MKKLTFIILALLACTGMRAQKWEKIGDRPQMGWSTWNKFAGNINEDIIRGITDAMVESGLSEAGYTYINIDDCWHGKRDKDGFIQPDAKKFPSGMKSLADYIHGKGLKLGIYSDCGTGTCAGMPGSFGHEYQDALQYARWEVDYLKEDWCNTTNINAIGAYQLMSDALREAGRPIFLSMCEWGQHQPWKWASEIGHSWRIGPDIWCNFDSTRVHKGGFTDIGVMQCIRLAEPLRIYAGPGHWNDPDMLEVGNGMAVNEDRAHFTMWCMLAAPLILGNDIRNMSQETKDIVMNREMIAIDQDELGVQGLHLRDEQGLEFWFKPLAGGDWAMTILNPTQAPITYDLNWQRFNLTDDQVSKRSTQFYNTIYKVRDLWAHKDEGKTITKDKTWRTVTVPARDVISYRLTPSKPAKAAVQGKKQTAQLLTSLHKIAKSGKYMFGHQDDPVYGRGWKDDEDRSDVKSVTGEYPPVMGFDLGRIELGGKANLDGVPFDRMRKEIIRQYERGGMSTLSWHADNPLTGGTAWVEGKDKAEQEKMTVASILEGGEQHQKFVMWLDHVADFLLSLKTEDGTPVPVLFRPWHEHTGSWFWWGQNICTREQYVALWRLTASRLKQKGVDNVLYAYSSGIECGSSEEKYLERYPGDDIIDVLGFDSYCMAKPEDKAALNRYTQSIGTLLTTVCSVAKKHGKVAALTETGYEGIPSDNWWTENLAPGIKGHSIAYVLVWRNAHDMPRHHYTPYPGHHGVKDFVKFYQSHNTKVR